MSHSAPPGFGKIGQPATSGGTQAWTMRTPSRPRWTTDPRPVQTSESEVEDQEGMWPPSQRRIFLLKQEPMAPALFFFSRAVIFKSGVSCRNIGQEQFHVTQSCGAAWI